MCVTELRKMRKKKHSKKSSMGGRVRQISEYTLTVGGTPNIQEKNEYRVSGMAAYQQGLRPKERQPMVGRSFMGDQGPHNDRFPPQSLDVSVNRRVKPTTYRQD